MPQPHLVLMQRVSEPVPSRMLDVRSTQRSFDWRHNYVYEFPWDHVAHQSLIDWIRSNQCGNILSVTEGGTLHESLLYFVIFRGSRQMSGLFMQAL